MKLRMMLATAIGMLLAGAAAAQQQKTIKDVPEYNAYMAALNTTDPAKKAAAMDDFVRKYPNSVVKIDALEQAMVGYQQAGDQARIEVDAKRLLQLQPAHVRALAVITVIERGRAGQGIAQALADMRGHAEQGLRVLPTWPKPEGSSDAEFAKLKDQVSAIFEGAAGFAALKAEDYAKARDAYRKAVKIDPTSLQDVYQLSIAELQASPIDLNGFWHIARAINLATAQKNAAAAQSMIAFGKAKYKRYHGGEDGWDQIVTQAAKQAAPPADFAGSIKPAPTPAEIAVTAVKENEPDTLSFGDMEFVLSYRDASPANKEAADKVWKAIRQRQKDGSVLLRMEVVVVSATPDAIEAAITDENQKSKTSDLHIVMAKRMDGPPVPGSTITITGVITNYVPKPFRFEMERGSM